MRSLPSAGVTRPPRYYEPLRHPTRPGLSLASCQLIPTAITAGASRVASGLLCIHAIAITPAGPMKLVRSSISIVCGLPCVTVRSAPAIVFSGPAQRSLTLWPARSRSRLATLFIESSDRFVASAAVSIATGWNEPVPGRELHPLKSSAFHGALLRQLTLCQCPRSDSQSFTLTGQQPTHILLASFCAQIASALRLPSFRLNSLQIRSSGRFYEIQERCDCRRMYKCGRNSFGPGTHDC